MHFPPTSLLIPHAELALTQAAARTGALLRPLRRAGFGLWRALESLGQDRARRQLLLLADRWTLSDPDLARQLRAACDYDALADLPAAAAEPSHAVPAGLAGHRE